MTLTEAEWSAWLDRLRAQRVAAGLPEYIVLERLHRLIGHVLATHAAKAGPRTGLRTRDPDRRPNDRDHDGA
jgi:hypothetical protein